MFLKAIIFLSMLHAATFLSAQEQQIEEPSQDAAKDLQSAQATQLSPGLLYYRDPETGELTVPPPHIARALQQDAINFSDAGLELVVLPDGTKMIDLQGRYQMSSVVKPGANGLEQHCTTHPHTLNAVEHMRLHQTRDVQ